ncbi:hypothetical protein ACH4NV_30580 [Streptomyces althioticus]|uniref:hypothetical protein n=1 Tax=Streptomyces althioticus TaxID=83380 RepID=UPI0037A13A30
MELSLGRLTGTGLLSGRLRRVGRTGTSRLRGSLAVGHSRRVGPLGTDRAPGCRRRIRRTGSGLTFGRLRRDVGALVRLAVAGAPGTRLPRAGPPRGALLRADRGQACLSGGRLLRTSLARSVAPRGGLPRVPRP